MVPDIINSLIMYSSGKKLYNFLRKVVTGSFSDIFDVRFRFAYLYIFLKRGKATEILKY